MRYPVRHLERLILTTALALFATATAQKPELTGEVASGLNDTMQFEMTFSTLLPSQGYVEYGKTAQYGQETPETVALEGLYTVTLTELEPETTYHYRTVLSDWSGTETISEDATFTTPPLSPPETVTLSLTGGEAQLSWEPTFGATRYAVKRAAQAGGPYEVVGRVQEPTFTDSTVQDGEPYFYVISTLASAGQASPNSAEVSSALSPALVDDDFEDGLDETLWRIYANTDSGDLDVEDGALVIQDIGNGSDYQQAGLMLNEPIDLTAAPTVITVEYAETGNAEQNPGFWNVGDLEGDDLYNHPGIRATVSADTVAPAATPASEGAFTPAESTASGLQTPYTLTWTITPPEGEGDFSATMEIDGEEVYSGTFNPGTFDPSEAYFYLYTSTPDEAGTSAIEAVSVTQAGAGGGNMPDGATAVWLFDEGEGESVADAVGESVGTFTGGQWAEGKFGSAAQISPGENFISVPWNDALSPEEGLTLSAWVYLNAYGEGDFPNRRVLQLGSYDPESQYGIEDNAYRLLFEFGEFIFDAGPGADPEQIAVAQDEYIGLETWHHVAGVYSGEAITLYIDGEEVATEPANGAALTAPEDARLFIGTKSDKAPEGDWWDGLIDEVAVFDRALSAEEIGSVMQGLGGTTVSASSSSPASGAVTSTASGTGSNNVGGDPAINRAKTPPTIDGDLSDWRGEAIISVPSSLATADVPDVTDDADLSVQAQLAYDDDNVYLAAEVSDDTLVFERSGDAIWENDALEVWLGAQQFGVTIADESPYLHSWGGLDLSGAEVAVVPHDVGYTVEASLPLAVLTEADPALESAPGSTYPVAVGADDADEAGGTRVGQVYFPQGWVWSEVETYAKVPVAE